MTVLASLSTGSYRSASSVRRKLTLPPFLPCGAVVAVAAAVVGEAAALPVVDVAAAAGAGVGVAFKSLDVICGVLVGCDAAAFVAVGAALLSLPPQAARSDP